MPMQPTELMSGKSNYAYQQLQEVAKLERESHQLWDNAMMNMHPGMSQEHYEKFQKQTYRATELHSQAMDLLENAIRQIEGRAGLDQNYQPYDPDDAFFDEEFR